MNEVSAPLVLIADDFADAREIYGDSLKLFGYRVAQACDGAEAVDRALELRPDLILMDLSMPNIDGWEATRRIKADPRTRHIPVIALTGYSMAGYAERARDAGCEQVITKPFLPPDLVKLVERMLNR